MRDRILPYLDFLMAFPILALTFTFGLFRLPFELLLLVAGHLTDFLTNLSFDLFASSLCFLLADGLDSHPRFLSVNIQFDRLPSAAMEMGSHVPFLDSLDIQT